MPRKRSVHFAVPAEQTVLVGVLKRKSDLNIFLTERWYRMPQRHAPKKPFGYLALYQPALFGDAGKRIEWYARVTSRRTLPRKELLPDEPRHLHANEPYVKLTVSAPRRLIPPVRNATPRRVSFGFTTIGRLLTAKNLLELYDVPPTEEIMRRALHEANIPASVQAWISLRRKGKRTRKFRTDFMVMCRKGKIAIECDNKKAHEGKAQQTRDRAKDAFLEKAGWRVMRFTEHDIILDLDGCVVRLRRTICSLGGTTR